MKIAKKFLIILSVFVIFASAFATSAYAAVVGVSFGAKYFPRFPCTCTAGAVWYFIVPKYGPVAYVVGSQAKSKYNLPYATQVLGLFNPLANESCWMGVPPYCTVFPTSGTIMPMVGSSI